MKLTVSQRVVHEIYGLGVISEADAEYTVIEFDEHGSKKFLTRIVSLQPSDEPAPKRRRARKKATKKAATEKTAASEEAAEDGAPAKKKATKKAAAKKTTKKASKSS